MSQQITIYPDGGMELLRVSSGNGLDLRMFGTVEARRVSDIVFDDAAQKWKIDILGQGLLTLSEWANVAKKPLPCFARLAADGVILLAEYEQAVDVEVQYFNARRVK